MGLGASPGTPAHQLGALALTQGDPGLLVCPTGGPTGVGGSYGDGACHRALRSPQRVCSDHCLRPQASGPSTQIPPPPPPQAVPLPTGRSGWTRARDSGLLCTARTVRYCPQMVAPAYPAHVLLLQRTWTGRVSVPSPGGRLGLQPRQKWLRVTSETTPEEAPPRSP